MTVRDTPTSVEAEADAEQARAGLVSTLSRLRDNLQPAHVVEEVMGNAKISASAISNQIWDTARKNPLPALMIGAGLAMIFGLGSRTMMTGSGQRASADQKIDLRANGSGYVGSRRGPRPPPNPPASAPLSARSGSRRTTCSTPRTPR